MLANTERERLVGDILSHSFEALSMEEFGEQTLPLLERVLDTSASFLYRCDEHGRLAPVAGTLIDCCDEYGEQYYCQDPVHPVLRRLNPHTFLVSGHPVWKDYVKSSAYNDFLRTREVDYWIHLGLLDTGYHEPGMIGLLLSRSIRQHDFSKDDQRVLARILPALQAQARRGVRLEQKLGTHPVLETILESNSSCNVALTLRGSFLWASKKAHDFLGLRQSGHQNIPPALAEAARQLGGLAAMNSSSTAFAPQVRIPRENGEPIRAELRFARTAGGVRFILVELEVHDDSPRLAETAARFLLTPAELGVLRLLAQGLSDADIGLRLCISHATVRTHVGRILRKLGVQSRSQAALVARGVSVG